MPVTDMSPAPPAPTHPEPGPGLAAFDGGRPAESVERAAALAQPGEYLTFFLAEEEYAVETARVQEIISLQHMAKLPRVPSFVRGVINLRGMVVPVVDLRDKLGFTPKAYDSYTVIIVVQVAGKTTGLIADSVSDVCELTTQGIQPPPDFARRVSADYVKGLGRHNERFLILLDLDRLLRRDELVLS